MTYEYIDKTEGLEGDLYYRFTQVDKDGKKKTYDKRKVHIENPEHAPKVYPNPTSSIVHVDLHASYFNDAKHTSYNIVDVEGKEVSKGVFSSTADNTINLSSFPNGTYIINIRNPNNGKITTTKVSVVE